MTGLYYTYKDEHGYALAEEEYLEAIKKIIGNYSLKTLTSTISHFSNQLRLGDSLAVIKKINQDEFGLVDSNHLIVHNRSLITLLQILFENGSHDREDQPVSNIDLFDLFILLNNYYEIRNEKLVSSSDDALFQFSFRDIQNSFNINDFRMSYIFFNDMIKVLDQVKVNIDIDNILKTETGIAFKDFVIFFNALNNKESNPLMQNVVNHLCIEVENLFALWKERKIKLEIPFNYSFILKFPIAKQLEELYFLSAFYFHLSLSSIIYRTLNENNPEKFKAEFGYKIAEPIIVKYLTETCKGINSKILNVKKGSGSYQWADFAMLNNHDIFLFEIKTSILNDKNKYVERLDYFLKNIDDKYVKNEGVSQQIKRLQDLEDDMDSFIKSNKQVLDPQIKYNIYPVLIMFDESFQAFGCNKYFKNKFQLLMDGRIFNKFNLGAKTAVLTINEILFLKTKEIDTHAKLELLKEFLTLDTLSSFRIFLNAK